MSPSSPLQDVHATAEKARGTGGKVRTYPRAAALAAWIALMFLGVLSHRAAVLRVVIPVLMVTLPFLLMGKVRIRFTFRDSALGLCASFVLVAPLVLVGLLSGHLFAAPRILALAYQLLAVSLPEETFFRGYLQETFGNGLRAVIVTSMLFMAAHVPRAFLMEEWHLILTFFPSLVMGWLYMKTKNILPGTIFHFAANAVFMAWTGR